MKTALLAVLAVSIGFALIVVRGSSNTQEQPGFWEPTCDWPEPDSIREEAQRLDTELQRTHRFRENVEQIRLELLSGCLQLNEAASRLERAAQTDRPGYLLVIDSRFPGRPVREQLALALLSHLRTDAQFGTLSRAERDVVDWLFHEHDWLMRSH